MHRRFQDELLRCWTILVLMKEKWTCFSPHCMLHQSLIGVGCEELLCLSSTSIFTATLRGIYFIPIYRV